MLSPQSPVVGEVPLIMLTKGFFRRRKDDRGKIFFGWDQDVEDGPTYSFPVLENGTVSNLGSFGTVPQREIVLTIEMSDLGIEKLQFTEERLSA